MCQPNKDNSCCAPGIHFSGCCYPHRRFLTDKEKREQLEAYRDSLKNEISGVEEQLKKMSE
jgi:hypothetical protein